MPPPRPAADPTEPPAPPRWQYNTCDPHELDAMGEQGWEAYWAERWHSESGHASGLTFHLKRRVPA